MRQDFDPRLLSDPGYAELHLRERMLCFGARPPTPLVWSIHHEYSPDKIHPLLSMFDTQARMSHPDLYQLTYARLSQDHIKIVKEFSEIGLRYGAYQSGANRVNSYLISMENLYKPPETKIFHSPYGEVFDIELMDSAFTSMELPFDMETYSAIGVDPTNCVGDDGVFDSPAYLQSSTRRFIAIKYAIQCGGNDHHVLRIRHSVGGRGIYVGNRSGLTNQSDDEFILPRNSKIKVSPTPETIEVEGHVFHMWDATRLNTEVYYDDSAAFLNLMSHSV